MPKYITPLGSVCTADEAMPHGRLLPGYKELLAEGESIGFDVAFRDAAPARSTTSGIYLTDVSTRAQNDRAARDAMRAAHYGLDESARLDDAAYQRSKDAPNNWRKDTARSAETVAAIRDARWL